jgi:nucleotide-binding universal stress UspA family protein
MIGLIHCCRKTPGRACEIQEHLTATEGLINYLVDRISRTWTDIRVDTQIVEANDPVSAILVEAKNWQADFIVINTASCSWEERTVIGSVTEAVAQRAGCSVQIIRHCAWPV